ncbi:hypothetical protein NDK47_22785 [Brevibacillus ruminantium]|uniref:Uncharacterized protein n=1 Tax=Brevibacillus ruminantium TaxID=2950604 RepID=A0ABY4WDU6_9BACL|nr:hypothetical protein [Brevibacillus ruminantium]USG64919.1 hypothetical protein NDK47_22785 [Brevibacillus ruminantium]
MKLRPFLAVVPVLMLGCTLSFSANASSPLIGKNQADSTKTSTPAAPATPAQKAPAPAKSPLTAAQTDIRQIQSWINAVATTKVTDELLKDLRFTWVQLDDDPELELVAKVNSSVHIGYFYILDRRPDGKYALVTEQPWNAPHLQLDRWDYMRFDPPEWSTVPPEDVGKVGGKRLFETLDRGGGTGISSNVAHLWYVENGKFVEAWKGTLLETASIPGGKMTQTIGQYQIVQTGPVPLLYYWKTTRELDPETGKPVSSLQTEVHTFTFDKGTFSPASSSASGSSSASSSASSPALPSN